jgi:hypothetical protein
VTINAGQRPFAYTAPSGFKALNTANLPAPVVTKPSDVMDVVTYTGNTATTRSITGLNFSPDLVWIKNRGSTYWNVLFDVVRGVGNQLSSNQTDAELASGSNIAGKVSSFDANGFTLASGSSGIYTVNENNVGHVAWTWDAGSSTVTNTQGSISSQVRANANAGFSVVTYAGNSTLNATIGHGLGVAPKWIIIKSRTSADAWIVLTTVIDGSQDYGILNSTSAFANDIVSSTPTSTVFSISGSTAVGSTGNNYVAYCFAPVAGYSSFGSYTGNGSADGPFVYTGHRSRFLLIKCSSLGGSGQNWIIIDTSRDTYNISENILRPNLSDAEVDYGFVDVLSNGFKLKNTDNSVNGSGQTYVYMALAESSFQYARAR